jgi:2-polyprenyl-6-methoxyphenol hydroxylase-like FAD-dependent oxidoreductase
MARSGGHEQRPDVAIVGAGIAGAALAALLARGGLEVLLLEREPRFRDRVRGEFLAPWGVAEAMEADLFEPLTTTPGAAVLTRYVPYDEIYRPAEAELRAVDLSGVLPDVPGALALGHPEACEALARAALAAGASVLRPLSTVRVADAGGRELRVRREGSERTVRARLVVGADGRGSSVRKAVGIRLDETAATAFGVGLLVEGLARWPAGTGAIGTEGNRHYAVFPRAGGRARLYLFCGLHERTHLSGPGAAQRFLEGFRLRCLPGAQDIAASRPIGPCAGFPMNDSWTDPPFAEGVVLVGDAAGASNPVVGQGLSVALRDATVLAGLLLGSARWEDALREYGLERNERMRRLRLTARLVGTPRCTFGPAGRRLRRAISDRFHADAESRRPALAALIGPHRLPADAFDPMEVEGVLSVAP